MFCHKNRNFYKAVIVSDDLYPESKRFIESLGIEIIPSFCNKNVSEPLWNHTDMQIVKIGDIYVCAPECYEYYRKKLKKFNVKLIKGDTELSSNYPCDIAYNITVTEKIAVHNFKYTDNVIKEVLSDIECIDVSQGYNKCSICLVSDSKFITSDNGLLYSLTENGCDVLYITPGSILLPGFDYGFIGGASFEIGENILAFNGNVDNHPDSSLIKNFCQSAGVELISLSEQSLMDIGSAVVIK